MYSQTFSVEIQYVCLLKPGILACQNRWCNSAIQRIITVRIKLVDGAGNWLVSLVNCDEKSIFFIQQTGLAAHWWHDKAVKHCFIYLHQNYAKHPGTYTLILSRKPQHKMIRPIILNNLNALQIWTAFNFTCFWSLNAFIYRIGVFDFSQCYKSNTSLFSY